jgi:hypothetical protein
VVEALLKARNGRGRTWLLGTKPSGETDGCDAATCAKVWRGEVSSAAVAQL